MSSLRGEPRRVSFDDYAPLAQYNGSSPPSSTLTDECREILLQYAERKSLQFCRRGPWMLSASGASYQRACDNKWACPMCSVRLLAKDEQDIARVLTSRAGAVFLTFSIQHSAPLAQSLSELLRVWSQAFSTGSWMTRFRTRSGMCGWVRVVEATFQKITAHPHIHAVFVFDRRPRRDDVDALVGQWISAASTHGFIAHTKAVHGGRGPIVAQGESRENVANYIVNQNAIRESKPGRGRTPGDLLHSVNATGDADDLARLLEFHAATKSKQKVTTSRGFRELAD